MALSVDATRRLGLRLRGQNVTSHPSETTRAHLLELVVSSVRLARRTQYAAVPCLYRLEGFHLHSKLIIYSS